MKIHYYFVLFILYSVIGWIIEVCNEYIHNKRFVNRGFLIGTYCPIYGYGALLMIILLDKYKDSIFALFCMSVFICSILEYFTSYIMEKLFNARWWDYSHYKFNINGRICLETMIPFGVAGTLLVHYLNPYIMNVLNVIPFKIVKVVSIILFTIFIIDNILSFQIILGFKKTTKKVPHEDSTLEITNAVRKKLMEKSIFSKRLIKSFPNVKVKKRKK